MNAKYRYGIVGLVLLAALVVGCDSDVEDEAQEQPVADQQQEAEPDDAESQNDDADEQPRANETEIPDDSEIGQLPEGIGVAAGESAPDVTTENADGEQVDVLELVEDEAIVLFFYRGGWCPYCNFQIREMTEAHDEFARRGVRPVAISVDRQEEAADTNSAYEIPFPVLSDPDLTVHRAFGVTYDAEAEEVEQLAEHGMDIEEASGRDHNSYAVPSIFIIDADGTVRWSHANLDYSIRPSTQQLLGVIDELFE